MTAELTRSHNKGVLPWDLFREGKSLAIWPPCSSSQKCQTIKRRRGGGGVVVKGGGGGAPLFRLQRRREAMKRDLSIRINPQCVWEEGAKTKAGGRGNRG